MEQYYFHKVGPLPNERSPKPAQAAAVDDPAVPALASAPHDPKRMQAQPVAGLGAALGDVFTDEVRPDDPWSTLMDQLRMAGVVNGRSGFDLVQSLQFDENGALKRVQ